jgi:NAD(P)-dependent dehydrogenase (short-subunit alcohol dehydrogenase family)
MKTTKLAEKVDLVTGASNGIGPVIAKLMRRRSVIDIVERFQTQHALQEEREMKNFHASTNGAVAPGVPDKNGMARNGIFGTEEVGGIHGRGSGQYVARWPWPLPVRLTDDSKTQTQRKSKS